MTGLKATSTLRRHDHVVILPQILSQSLSSTIGIRKIRLSQCGDTVRWMQQAFDWFYCVPHHITTTSMHKASQSEKANPLTLQDTSSFICISLDSHCDASNWHDQTCQGSQSRIGFSTVSSRNLDLPSVAHYCMATASLIFSKRQRPGTSRHQERLMFPISLAVMFLGICPFANTAGVSKRSLPSQRSF